jgi:hypothetical protein
VTCNLLLFIAVLAAITWVTPDILSVIGRALGGIGRLVKRHPAISLTGVWIVLMMVAQQAAHQ